MSAENGVSLLDEHLLAQLETAWAAQGAPRAEHPVPGLSDDEIDAITAPLGLRLPREARVWWGQSHTERSIGPGLTFRTLPMAVDAYLMERRIAAEVEGDPDAGRPAAFFPITYSSGPIFCDCSVPEGAPSPIYYTHTHGNPDEELARPRARSFGEMVTWWIEALTDGIWRWDTTRGAWDYDWNRVDLERSGLV